MKGWHFLREDRRLNYPPHRLVKPGEWIKATGELEMCKNGMHFSPRIIDALTYAPGPIVCRVEVAGNGYCKDDKCVYRKRRVIWMADATRTLHLFACWCAENSLSFVKNPDPRSIQAVSVKRKWLDGKASDNELGVAGAAAGYAVWAAARTAAKTAAGDAARAAARAAARTAARTAAKTAAGDAARAAARAAARDTAWAAAWAAAGDAARDAQNRKLVRMVCAIREKERA